RTRVLLTSDVERDFPYIRRVEGLAARRRMSADAGLSDLEASALQAQFSRPACGNHEFVGVRLFEEHADTVVPEGVRHVLDDLLEKNVGIKCGVDPLCHALQQIEVFNVRSGGSLAGTHWWATLSPPSRTRRA